LVVDEGGERKVVEQICEKFPYVGVSVLTETFIVEAIDLGDLAGFVVPTEDRDALGVSDFESNEEGDGFDGVVSSINIITHKKVVRIWIWSPNSEELHQVMELAVDISTYCHRTFHWLHV